VTVLDLRGGKWELTIPVLGVCQCDREGYV